MARPTRRKDAEDTTGSPQQLATEYENLVARYYPDKLTKSVVKRMRELEAALNLETLVPDDFGSG